MQDFRRETIYFIVVDRFCDGDPSNNHAKCDAQYDPTHTDWQLYWGGDLEGIVQKLDYIHGLGASAIWITPVFKQSDSVVIENGVRRAPYHGYWAQDFKRIDEHLVERPEDVRVFASHDSVFDRLVAELHRRGGKLILDIVCNHSSPHLVGGRGELYDDGVKLASYDEDSGGWYHHLGDVQNWSDLDEVQKRDLCSLSDFDEESHRFRTYIKQAIRLWIDKGVDGLRVDTVKHMPLWFWQEFVSDMRRHKPGLFMFLVGDCPELGDWDYDRAVPMNYVNSNTWFVDVPFDGTCGSEFAYKYFVRVGGKLSRERALPRRRTAPSEGYRRFRDDWSSHLPE